MDNTDAQKQIEQMVGFIFNEANERANQILADASEDFNKEKLKLVMAMREKVRTDNAKKRKAVETKKAIDRSTQVNRARLKKIEARQQCIEGLQKEAIAQLQQVSKTEAKYKQILVDLILQGCLKLMEPEVTVRCRERDASLVSGILDTASQAFSKYLQKEASAKRTVRLSLDKQWLPATSVGGVVCSCQNGAIIVDNSLDKRLGLMMENDRPALRQMLFN